MVRKKSKQKEPILMWKENVELLEGYTTQQINVQWFFFWDNWMRNLLIIIDIGGNWLSIDEIRRENHWTTYVR